MIETEVDVHEDYHATFHGHMAELFRRILFMTAGSLFVGLISFLFSTKLAAVLYGIVNLGGPANAIHPASTLTDNVLLSAVIALIAFFYLFLSQTYAFVAPGLYPDERKTFLIPFVWAGLSPIMAFGFLGSYSAVLNKFSLPPLMELGIIRAWLIRFFLITALSTLLLALPRRKSNLTLSVFILLCLIIWILPNHFFDTLVVVSIGVCFILCLTDWLVVSIWKDVDVETSISAESYLNTHN